MHLLKGRKMKPVSEMSFEEWLAFKHDEQKLKTHGAELVQDERIYALAAAINKVCFAGELTDCILRIYFIPDDLKKLKAAAIYGYRTIMIDQAFYQIHGTDNRMKDAIFHELVHGFCDSLNPANRIKDTDSSGYHLPAFAAACSDHGGYALLADPESGYSDVHLSGETITEINKALKQH